MVADNKVVFGLKNAHYAIISEDAEGLHTYGTVLKLDGAVEISLEPKGEQTDFFADDRLYYTTTSNQGYTTTLTVANIPNDFRTEVLGEVLEPTDNVLTENANAKPKSIAFMFEFDGDIKATRHLLYNCTVSRPPLSSATKTEAAEPTTQELTLVAAPRPADSIVRRSTTAETPDTVYNGWYSGVYTPAVV
jgi:phi13 family phage major tail protein